MTSAPITIARLSFNGPSRDSLLNPKGSSKLPVAGCLPPERKCCCLRIHHAVHVPFSWHDGISSRNHTSHRSYKCAASPNDNRRNSDFSRQNKSFSRGRSGQQNQEKENSDNIDGLVSKNGPLVPLSSSSRYQATAIPGQKEREILELFRKVQTQLRQRTAIKEEKKIESSKQGPVERGTVDSLLTLLKRHSVAQGKNNSSDREFNVEHKEQNTHFDDEQNSNFFETNSFASEEDTRENVHRGPFRPASNFQRKSPVPRVKYQPVYSANKTVPSDLKVEAVGQKTKKTKNQETDISDLEPEESIFLDECEEELEDELPEPLDVEEIEEEVAETSVAVDVDLTSMKYFELRELAKSRGLKGYSKLKKLELVKLLEGI